MAHTLILILTPTDKRGTKWESTIFLPTLCHFSVMMFHIPVVQILLSAVNLILPASHDMEVVRGTNHHRLSQMKTYMKGVCYSLISGKRRQRCIGVILSYLPLGMIFVTWTLSKQKLSMETLKRCLSISMPMYLVSRHNLVLYQTTFTP